MQASIRWEGLNELRVGFSRLARIVPDITVEGVEEVATRAMKRSVPWNGGSNYSIPERGYTRTGNLGRSTFVERDGYTVTIQSQAYTRHGRPYSRHVIGDGFGEGQAKVHNGIWVPMKKAVDDEVEELSPRVEANIARGIQQSGL